MPTVQRNHFCILSYLVNIHLKVHNFYKLSNTFINADEPGNQLQVYQMVNVILIQKIPFSCKLSRVNSKLRNVTHIITNNSEAKLYLFQNKNFPNNTKTKNRTNQGMSGETTILHFYFSDSNFYLPQVSTQVCFLTSSNKTIQSAHDIAIQYN